jgi:RNA polymerase sigma-70 factor (ECF subfamily)
LTRYAVGVGVHPAPDPTIESQLEEYRVELTGYCYRMLGSAFEAEDAVQETMTRAWRSISRFEGRSALRTWLYRIASNVCFDLLNARQKRARPMDLSGPSAADDPIGIPLVESTWIEPMPDAAILPAADDPAVVAAARESVRLAFIAALQFLPPRQRAVLLLREVLRLEASEVADLLETTVPSVNSALQRARATMSARDLATTEVPAAPDSEADRELLARYVEAFEAYDIDRLTKVIREDALQSMPPYAMWLRGRPDILDFWFGPGIKCSGSRLVPVEANGRPAFGQYRPADDGSFEPWAIVVLEPSAEGIAELTFFLDTQRLFPLFGLPPRLDR